MLVGGCVTLPKIEPAALIQNVTNAYASCASFEDHGTVCSKEIADGETNIARSVFQLQFLRNKAFKFTLNVDRKYGVGPYSLIYYWDGSNWSSYDSIETHYGLNPVHTNTDIAGSGAASTFGLIPPLPVLLKLSPGYFSEMRLFTYGRAQVSVERLKGKWVYHLRLENNLGEGSLLDDYWIRPMDWLVLKHRRHAVFVPSAGTTNVVTRETVHSPKKNSQITTNMFFFNPPAWSPPHITYSGGDGLTPKDAIMVHGVGNKDELLTFEIERLKAVYPGFHLGDITDASSEGKSYDKFAITASDGKHRVVYFLIPDFNDSKPH